MLADVRCLVFGGASSSRDLVVEALSQVQGARSASRSSAPQAMVLIRLLLLRVREAKRAVPNGSFLLTSSQGCPPGGKG